MKLLPLVMLSAFSGCSSQQDVPQSVVKEIIADSSADEKNRQEIGNYATLMMKMVETKQSNAARNTIAKAIVNVSMEIFSSQEERKQFVVLVGIESKFSPKAKSGAGAVGLTQVIPKYAQEFGAKCGLNDVTREDLDLIDVNLLVGACRFKALLDKLNSNVALALVAYNAGANSDQLKQLKTLNNITNVETSSYVAKYTFLRSKADNHEGDTSEDTQSKPGPR